DKLGRDIFARVLYGGRVSIYVGLFSALGETILGVIIGSIAGYFGSKLDALLIKLSELVMTFPGLILILFMISVLGQGINNLVIILTITGWTTTFRLTRTEFLSLREETYVAVSKTFGISRFAIMFKHMLPNAISPIIVALTVNIGGYILAEAGLSF